MTNGGDLTEHSHNWEIQLFLELLDYSEVLISVQIHLQYTEYGQVHDHFEIQQGMNCCRQMTIVDRHCIYSKYTIYYYQFFIIYKKLIYTSIIISIVIHHFTMSTTTIIENFWTSISGKKNSLTQLQRYEQKNAPDCIRRFIAIGGGVKMGTTLENFARFKFKSLHKRGKGKKETGYDHQIKLAKKTVFVEQKSSGHWGDTDYKWQHIEKKHKWTMLLLCGIDYTDIKFWGMDRKTFHSLIAENKITNQGNKEEESSEGMWLNYSDVKDSLVEIQTDEQLVAFASSLQNADESS